MNGSVAPGESGYCAVTIVSGKQRLDVALPAAVPWADLAPGVARLLPPLDLQRTAGHWVLTPIGGTGLAAGDTLSAAGILSGDVLVLGEQPPNGHVPRSTVGSVRDRLEDAVEGRGCAWTARTSARFALWTAATSGAALLPAAASLPGGGAVAALDATMAIVIAGTAVLASRRTEPAAAAVCLLVGCCWAAVAGVVALCGGPSPWMAGGVWLGGSAGGVSAGSAGLMSTGGVPAMIACAAVAAWLLAVCAAAMYPTAAVHATALTVIAGTASGLACAAVAGSPPLESGCVAALVALLVVGAAPRLALVWCRVISTETPVCSAMFEIRLARADRMLTGLVIGLTTVAVLGAVPAALSPFVWHRLLAAGIGMGLLLRSRAFSQVPHVLGPRIGAVVMLAGLWVGLFHSSAASPVLLLLVAAVVVGAVTLVSTVVAPTATAIGRARASRALDVAELVLVSALVVLAAGVLGLFEWLSSVTG